MIGKTRAVPPCPQHEQSPTRSIAPKRPNHCDATLVFAILHHPLFCQTLQTLQSNLSTTRQRLWMLQFCPPSLHPALAQQQNHIAAAGAGATSTIKQQCSTAFSPEASQVSRCSINNTTSGHLRPLQQQQQKSYFAAPASHDKRHVLPSPVLVLPTSAHQPQPTGGRTPTIRTQQQPADAETCSNRGKKQCRVTMWRLRVCFFCVCATAPRLKTATSPLKSTSTSSSTLPPPCKVPG